MLYHTEHNDFSQTCKNSQTCRNSGDSLTITVPAIIGKLKIRIMMLIVLIFQTPIRRQMKAKQASAQSYGVTSSTARRILQSLEKLSSPLAVNYSLLKVIFST